MLFLAKDAYEKKKLKMTTPRANYITYPHFYAFIYCSFAVNIQKWLEMIRHTDFLTLHITDPL